MNVGILGATGYSGEELIELLSQHPQADLSMLVSNTTAGQRLDEVLPRFRGRVDLMCEPLDIDVVIDRCQAVCVALPHAESMAVLPKLVEAGLIVVDLAADFRLRDPEIFQRWYCSTHVAPELLADSVYGLPEVSRAEIAQRRWVANPGCYPTGLLLGMWPLAQAGMLTGARLICDGKSGVTGAGRRGERSLLFGEVNEGLHAYKMLEHQHQPEMQQTLDDWEAGVEEFVFIPHLVPLNRGLFSTIYVWLKDSVTADNIAQRMQDAYGHEPFIRLCGDGTSPRIQDVAGTNYCDIGWVVDPDRRLVVVMTAIDNLGKGAAGQAVQNLNLLAGWPETLGLLPGEVTVG